MCGIFGFVAEPGSLFQREQFQPLLNQLFRLSESRGKDASGVALVTDGQLQVLKRPQRARSLIRTREYAAMIRAAHGPGDEPLLVMGHARMVTNGRKEYHVNNQPVIKQGRVCLHNGIVVNDGALWAQFAGLRREYEVDTEIILSLIEHFCQQGQTLIQAVVSTFRHIEGANSIALLDSGINGLVLATSNGSLYFARGQAGRELVFASEKYIIERTVQHPAVAGLFAGSGIQQVGPGQGYAFQTGDLSPLCFTLDDPARYNGLLPARAQPLRVHDHVDGVAHILPDWNGAVIDRSRYPANDAYMQRVNEAVSRLRRCERCLLPESFPFIIFDGDGVCNYCQQYRPFPFKGEDALRELVAPYRRQDGRPDCLVPLSGGRDSSYGLHYIRQVLGLNPVAYTYDWGMVTDLARRNISRMCGRLGVEHILISADIGVKRENIRKNVEAWLRQPELGMVPLFMAGDKQFFYYSNMLRKQMRIDLVLFSMNPLERTDFKVGFTGINEVGRKQEKHYALAFGDRLRMMGYYAQRFVQNPAYLNASLVDSLFAFVSYYMIPKDYHILYEYLRWDEREIEQTILNEYDWETATDTDSTWRIGDGTASFYNYIYYTLAGFSENDTMRSNQIREGMLTREAGLRLAEQDNQPRYDSMRWYAETIGFDFERAIDIINRAPKRYPFA